MWVTSNFDLPLLFNLKTTLLYILVRYIFVLLVISVYMLESKYLIFIRKHMGNKYICSPGV